MSKEDGTTEADSLTRALSALENRRGKAFEEKKREIQETLDLPDLPEEYLDCWTAFSELNSARTNNGYGPNPLSYSEIHAYLKLTQRLLLPYEIKGIKTIDAVFMKVNADLSRAASNARKTSAHDSSTPTRKPAPKRR